MDPSVVGLSVGGLVVLGMGLALGLFAYGRSTRDAEVGALRREADAARAALRAEREESARRAAGAEVDLGRAAALADARARGDVDGVLRQFPDAGAGAAAGKQGGEADEAGGGSDGAP